MNGDGDYRIHYVSAWGEEVLALQGHPPQRMAYANYGNLNIIPSTSNQPLVPIVQPNQQTVTRSVDTPVTTTVSKGNKSAEKQDLQCTNIYPDPDTKDSVFKKWKAEKQKVLQGGKWRQENLRRQQYASNTPIGQIHVPTAQADSGTTNTLTKMRLAC